MLILYTQQKLYHLLVWRMPKTLYRNSSKQAFNKKQSACNIIKPFKNGRKWIYGLISTAILGSGGCVLLLSQDGLWPEFTTSHFDEWKKDKWTKWSEKICQIREQIYQFWDLFPTRNLTEPLDETITKYEPSPPLVDYFEEWLTLEEVEDESSGDSSYDWRSLFASLLAIFLPWEQSKSDSHWLLLSLTKSKNFWIRQMGVASLANKLHWDEYQYRDVAQACNSRTTVALARYPYARDGFFLPPPKLHQSQDGVLEELRSQLSKLPVPKTCCSISYFRHIALDQDMMCERVPVSMDMDVTSHLYAVDGEDEQKKEKLLTFCLEALLAYSSMSEYAYKFVENQGLSVLQRLQQEREEPWVQVYIASILLNISQLSTLLDDIVSTGWVYILRQWVSSEDANLSLLALTSLANLDQDWTSRDIFQDMILIHPTKRNSKPVKADVVFVHGLRGGAVKTWRQGKSDSDSEEEEPLSQCWPRDWLAADCSHLRIISIGYNSNVHRWGDYCPYEPEKRTLEGRSDDLIRKLKRAGVGSRPIIWVGHSMGGLLIKNMLAMSDEDMNCANMKSETKGIILYSVPHHGSSVVDAMMYAKYLLFPSVEVQELLTTSPKLMQLHDKFIRFIVSNSIPLISFGENEKTEVGKPLPKVMVVPPESSDPGIGKFISLPADHIDTCKPTSESDISYQTVVAFIKDVIDRLPQS